MQPERFRNNSEAAIFYSERGIIADARARDFFLSQQLRKMSLASN
jgi:hypothetical protein